MCEMRQPIATDTAIEAVQLLLFYNTPQDARSDAYTRQRAVTTKVSNRPKRLLKIGA